MTHRWRHARWVNLQHVFGDIQAVKTIGDKINTDRRDDYPQRVYLFPPVEGDIAKGKGSDNGEQCPYKVFP